jgi:Ca-activated chloride channel homolog
MKLEVLIGSISLLWPLWASAAPSPVSGPPLQAPPAPRTGEAPGDEPRAGALLLYAEEASPARLAPQLSQRVELRVTGLIGRAHVVQSFQNQSDDVVHAVYTFPLPETAAVDGLTLRVGERRIVGEIRERAAAQRSFEQAAERGQKASLIDQQRPNLFSTRLANIGPHETVEVELSYQQEVTYDAGAFALEFPATLTPRYATAPEAQAGVTPPFTIEDGPTLSLDVTLDAGVPLQRIASPSHALKVQASAAGPVHVSLAQGEVLADRDVRLEWAPAPDGAPRSALFEEQLGTERYALLMLLPPDPGLDAEGRLPRETTFIIDTSGSMSGASMQQARLSLESGLAALRPVDRFNVIQFDDTASAFFPRPVPATAEHVREAQRRVRQLDADGGTEMLTALVLAFDVAAASEALSQVVFVTDGSVGNEPEVFRFIEHNLGPRRLFTVGIGAAPNRYFMRGAARLGRGTFTSVSDANEVGARMQALWTKLDAPLVRNVDVDFGGDGRAEVLPARVPDLYRGEPLVVVAKLGAAGPAVRVRGQRAGRAFDAQLPLRSRAAAGEVGIHRLWARRQIESLMDRVIEGEDEERIRPRVTALALKHRLLSQYTSLVAVDPARSVAGPGQDVAVPNAVPAGNTMFGNMPRTATPGPLYLIVGGLALGAAWWLRPRRRALGAAPATRAR